MLDIQASHLTFQSIRRTSLSLFNPLELLLLQPQLPSLFLLSFLFFLESFLCLEKRLMVFVCRFAILTLYTCDEWF